MIEDDIQREIRQYRQEHARRFNYDISAMWDDARLRSEESGRPIHPWKPPQPEQITEAIPATINHLRSESVFEAAPSFEDK